MNHVRYALPFVLGAVLAACGSQGDESTDLEVATTDGEAKAIAEGLPVADLADLTLGAKIVGPRGPEVKTRLTNTAGAFADITSYVACPAGMDPCDPKTAPEGTIYTYVHKVFPGEDNQQETGSGMGADSADIEIATQFMMTRPAHGFTGSAGFFIPEVIAAAGPGVKAIITCVDGGIAWTINAGDGGNQWEQAEPITFFWQSTLPPAGPANAYAIKANYVNASGEGPYPADKAGVANACTASSTAG